MLNKKKAAGETAMQVFIWNEFNVEIRGLIIDGNPWLVAKDLCDYLELSDVSKSLERLDDDEKLTRKVFVSGQERAMWLVNESGTYALILRSNKPKARGFRKWITNDLLPTLRETGRYEMAKASMDSDSVDLRDQPYEQLHYMDGLVRVVMLDGEAWYSINDIHRCIGSRTESSQSVKRLNAKRELAKKIFLFGMTHPGWFTTKLGVQLILSASQKMKGSGQLMLDFKDEEGK